MTEIVRIVHLEHDHCPRKLKLTISVDSLRRAKELAAMKGHCSI